MRLIPAFVLAVAAVSARAQAPSQRELNGFLLGQDREAIAASFVKLLQTDSTSDRWIVQAYLVDRAHHAYMAFRFPRDRRDCSVSVQIAGDSGTPMLPFLGLRIGDHRDLLLARLGRPATVQHEGDLKLDLYDYAHRNYSFEVNSQGRISSIQIYAYSGFPEPPKDVAPSLDSLVHALDAGGEAALDYLMPDVEVYRGNHVFRFTHGALADLTAPNSEIRSVLSEGATSVAAVLRDSTLQATADVNVRLWEQGGVGWVWKFPAPALIEEVVYKAEAGKWRVWEVRYR